jgi:hypothetical protein
MIDQSSPNGNKYKLPQVRFIADYDQAVPKQLRDVWIQWAPGAVQHFVDEAYNFLTSKAARRTAFFAATFFTATIVLYGSAVIAYGIFYFNYIPHRVRTVPVHLQYG